MTRWYDNINLGGTDWQFGCVPSAPLWQSDDLNRVHHWRPAHVPGNVESDLLTLGQISDPFITLQKDQRHWPEDNDWWYCRRVALPLQPGQRAHLIFHGIDYYSAVYVNGTCLAHHEGMFSRQIFDVTHLARQAAGGLDVAVRLWGAHALPKQQLNMWQHLAGAALQRIVGETDMFPARIHTVKCQMSFGWDFAPRLPAVGIWDDVELALSGPIFIADIWVRACPQNSHAQVVLSLTLDSTVSGCARLTTTVRAANSDKPEHVFTSVVAVVPGQQRADIAFTLPSARLWQPWDRGTPHLYEVTVEIQPPGSALSSKASTIFGIRSVQMWPNPGVKGTDHWVFVINGQREFIRGLNWVPCDALPGRVRQADYTEMIGMARQANANMLRVWGGGLREKRAFYDLCDSVGILVWQEFPFACPNLLRYPQHGDYLSLVENEATGIVQALRNHPSLVFWCGGNEFSPARNKPVVSRLRRAVEQCDGTRPFCAASPSTSDRHNWQVWHHYAPLTSYRRESAAFISEFGLQSVPDAESLRQFIPDDEIWPPGSSWHRHGAQLGKLHHYARTMLYPVPARVSDITLEQFIRASQVAQALGIQIMVEHMRRRKYQASGVMVWQFNEPWPGITWSLVGYDRRPKLAYHVLQRVFQPLLISVEYAIKQYQPGETVELTLWLINDHVATPSPIPGEGGHAPDQATLLLTLDGHELHRQSVDMKPDSSMIVGHVALRLPHHQAPWLLHAELWQGDSLLSHNEYDLGYHDERTMPLLHILLTRLGSWLLR